MKSISNKARIFGPHHGPLCTRTYQIGALALVVVTFFLTRLFDSCTYSSSSSGNRLYGSVNDAALFAGGGWPLRGYGTHLSLRIYVYEEREIDGLRELMYGLDRKIPAEACVKGQWGTQVKIHRMLLQSSFRTRKKEEADLFFVPTYVKCVRMMGGLSDKKINQTYVKKALAQSVLFLKSNLTDVVSMQIQGDRTDKRDASAFSTWKDIIIPGNVDDGMTTHGAKLAEPLPLSERKYLANYLGRAQGKLGRLQLIELAKQFPNKLESPELKLSGPEKLGRTEYFQHLRNAKFCLAPRGESSWTLRFYESFFVECVPVILSDQVELPFQNVIDYAQISIKWPSSRIGPQLLEYLESIPGSLDTSTKVLLTCFNDRYWLIAGIHFSDKNIEEMIALGRKVRCLWVYAPDSEPCSAFKGIMWELQRKVRQFHHSAETFWLHNGTIVNRNLVEFSKWKPPLPLP
ncbi:hypothetical protein RJ639_037153 [Escallonia herrerae]|uniref:Exostosin GT47 domain-containing protein n=1 Tax=Escallonia herrerae TaxID=1293975 RepID=A0AA88WQZ6_9ASTE|nr:hypothetical protein RJ639_037153 [Escallonia herrerae]